MNKSASQQGCRKVIAAAASVTMLSCAASRGDGGLVIDLLALPGSGYGLSSAKRAVVDSPGVTVTIGVYARINGVNSAQQIGDWDHQGDAPDTRNDDSLDIVTGSFQSVGGLLGNMNPVPGPLTYNSIVVPFTATSSRNGVAADIDSDGDLDIGALGTDPTNMWIAVAGAMAFPTLFDGTANGWSLAGFSDNWGLNAEDMILDPSTGVMRLGTIRFTAVSSPPGITAVNFVPRPLPQPGSALWWEDGVATGKYPGTGLYSVGAPVDIEYFVPEPTALGLLALCGVGLSARRQQRR